MIPEGLFLLMLSHSFCTILRLPNINSWIRMLLITTTYKEIDSIVFSFGFLKDVPKSVPGEIKATYLTTLILEDFQ